MRPVLFRLSHAAIASRITSGLVFPSRAARASIASERPYGGWLVTAGLLCIVIHYLQRIAAARDKH